MTNKISINNMSQLTYLEVNKIIKTNIKKTKTIISDFLQEIEHQSYNKKVVFKNLVTIYCKKKKKSKLLILKIDNNLKKILSSYIDQYNTIRQKFKI